MTLENVRVCVGRHSTRVISHTITADNIRGQVSGSCNDPASTDHCDSPAEVAVVLDKFMKKWGCSKSFEWQFDLTEPKEIRQANHTLKRHLKFEFRTQKLVFSANVPKEFELDVLEMCDERYLKSIDKISLPADCAAPCFVFDTFHPNYHEGVTMRFSKVYPEPKPFEDVVKYLVPIVMAKPTGSYVTYRADKVTDEMRNFWRSYDAPTDEISNNVFVKRQVVGPVVLRHNFTTCGYWITAVRKSNEKNVDWKEETCGLGEFCIKGCGAFEHNYFMGIASRVGSDRNWRDDFSMPCRSFEKAKEVSTDKEKVEILTDKEKVEVSTDKEKVELPTATEKVEVPTDKEPIDETRSMDISGLRKIVEIYRTLEEELGYE